jgi:hypothetical protein
LSSSGRLRGGIHASTQETRPQDGQEIQADAKEPYEEEGRKEKEEVV